MYLLKRQRLKIIGASTAGRLKISQIFGQLSGIFTKIRFSQKYTSVLDESSKMTEANWFEGARLNFAENLLRFEDDELAIISKTEEQPAKYVNP